MTRFEKLSYWRGKEATRPQEIKSGRILYTEDTGEVFLDYKDYLGDGDLKRIQLTDKRKLDANGGTLQGPIYAFRIPEVDDSSADLELVPKIYVDSVRSALNVHKADVEPDRLEQPGSIHVTNYDRNYWNQKVDEVIYNATQTGGQKLGTLVIDGEEFVLYAPFVHDIDGNAATATTLQNPHFIDGIQFDGSQNVIKFYVCSSEADESIKEINVGNTVLATDPSDDTILATGLEFTIWFSQNNTAENLQLQVIQNISGESSIFGPYPIQCQSSDVVGSTLTQGLYKLVFVLDHFEVEKTLELLPVTTSRDGLMTSQDKRDFESLKTYVYDEDTGITHKIDIIQTKLNTIEENANYYVLPEASQYSLGGIKIGSNITVDEHGVISLNDQDIINALGYVPSDREELPSSNEFSGATISQDGAKGLVPKPLAGQQNLFLRGNGTWSSVESSLQPFRKQSNPYYQDVHYHIVFETQPDIVVQDLKANFPATGVSTTLYVDITDPDNIEYYAWDEDSQTYIKLTKHYRYGKDGLVPMPTEDKQNSYLRDDGTWVSLNRISEATIESICTW